MHNIQGPPSKFQNSAQIQATPWVNIKIRSKFRHRAKKYRVSPKYYSKTILRLPISSLGWSSFKYDMLHCNTFFHFNWSVVGSARAPNESAPIEQISISSLHWSKFRKVEHSLKDIDYRSINFLSDLVTEPWSKSLSLLWIYIFYIIQSIQINEFR